MGDSLRRCLLSKLSLLSLGTYIWFTAFLSINHFYDFFLKMRSFSYVSKIKLTLVFSGVRIILGLCYCGFKMHTRKLHWYLQINMEVEGKGRLRKSYVLARVSLKLPLLVPRKQSENEAEPWPLFSGELRGAELRGAELRVEGGCCGG